MRSGILLCLAIFAAPSWVAAADAADGANLFGRLIRRIEYLDAGSLRPLEGARYDRSINLKAGRDKLTRTGLKAALQALYDTGSFSNIVAYAMPEEQEVRLQFRVNLSTYFSRFFLSKGIDLGGRSAAEAMGLPVGERFTEQELQAAIAAVRRFMQGQGFYQAEVTARWARDGVSDRIDTTFDIKPGPQAHIRSLTIEGVPPAEIPLLQERLGYKAGQKYRHDRFIKRMDGLKKYLVDRGYLDAELFLKGDPDSYQAGDQSIALDLSILNFGQVRIAIDGYKIPKDEQRRLLPVLTGEGLRPESVGEGAANLRDYLEEGGYPEAVVTADETSPDAAGARRLRYTVDRGRRILVSDIRFLGNHAYATVELMRAIQMQPARSFAKFAFGITRIDSFLQRSTYSVTKLDADVESLRSLYNSAGYLEAKVVPVLQFATDGNSVDLTLECTEGKQALARAVTINGRPPAELFAEKLGLGKPVAAVLAGKMNLKQGHPYSPALVKHDRQIILAAFNDAGFLQAAVTPVSAALQADSAGNNGYQVNFEVKEGEQSRIDRIIVVGRNRTRPSVVDKRIKLTQDEPLSLGKMLETQQALYNTGVFDLVRVDPQNPESNAPYQNVIVHLQEARPRTLRYGLGYQELEKVRGFLELSDANIFGLGQSVNLRLRGSKIAQAAVLSFKQPQVLFLPVDSYLTFSGSKQQQISFTERRLDLSYQYSRPLNTHSWSIFRYSFTNVRVSQVTPDLAREENPRNLSTISTYYINDTRDNYSDRNARYLDPQKGFLTSTNLSFTVNHGGSGYYLTLFTQDSYYRRLTNHLFMAASLRFGALYPFGGVAGMPAADRIPISERFFAGGASTLRGFAVDRAGPLGLNNEPVGGNALLIGNYELRVPLISRVEIAGFYDGGNVFTSLGAIRLSDISHNVGIGLRLKTPFGPIRLDYGFNLSLTSQLRALGYKQGHFYLTIGPPF